MGIVFWPFEKKPSILAKKRKSIYSKHWVIGFEKLSGVKRIIIDAIKQLKFNEFRTIWMKVWKLFLKKSFSALWLWMEFELSSLRWDEFDPFT